MAKYGLIMIHLHTTENRSAQENTRHNEVRENEYPESMNICMRRRIDGKKTSEWKRSIRGEAIEVRCGIHHQPRFGFTIG